MGDIIGGEFSIHEETLNRKKQNTKYMSLHHAFKDVPLEYR